MCMCIYKCISIEKILEGTPKLIIGVSHFFPCYTYIVLSFLRVYKQSWGARGRERGAGGVENPNLKKQNRRTRKRIPQNLSDGHYP